MSRIQRNSEPRTARRHPREAAETRPDHEAERRAEARQCVTVTAMVKEVTERRLGDAGVEKNPHPARSTQGYPPT